MEFYGTHLWDKLTLLEGSV